MLRIFLKITAACLIIGLVLCGCGQQKQPQTQPSTSSTEPTKTGKPILSTNPTQSTAVDFTPVYVSAFGDTLFLSTVPLDTWDGEEPECPAREISCGGSACCRGEHEKETPITKVIILEDLVPRSTAGWFRSMVDLKSVEGLDLIHVDHVEDMNHMFAACAKLTQWNEKTWKVSSTADMTGMFDGCYALEELPAWYKP